MYKQDWQNADTEQACYRTGFTQPKKTNRGILAALLMLVIFLGGINTAFRLLDIRLFREITKDAGISPTSVRFSAENDQPLTEAPNVPALGISGTIISEFEHLYYNIPAGFYITEVVAGSPANQAGLQPGDVLLYFNGYRTSDLKTLEQKIAACNPNEPVYLLLHRKKAAFSVEIRLDNTP